MQIDYSKLHLGVIWLAITTTISALLWMMSTFASASEVQEIQLDIAYGQFYDRLRDYEEALEQGEDRLAIEYLKQMERLKAKICKEDPEWERCD